MNAAPAAGADRPRRPPDPIIFIGGSPRSGTTMLRNMLSSHPLVAVPEESGFVHDVHRQLAAVRREDDLDLGWALIRRHRTFLRWGLDPGGVEQAMADFAPRSYADVVRAVFGAYAAGCGKPMCADKTPFHAQVFDWLSELFPSSRFVHLVRDPREVCMSLTLQHWQTGGIAGAAHSWALHAGRAMASGAKLGPRYIEVRYEDLVAEPADQLDRICRLASIPYDDAMLRYHARRDYPAYMARERAGSAPRLGARRWRDEMCPADVALVEGVAGKVMDRARYARAASGPRWRSAPGRARYRFIKAGDWWLQSANSPLHRAWQLAADRCAAGRVPGQPAAQRSNVEHGSLPGQPGGPRS